MWQYWLPVCPCLWQLFSYGEHTNTKGPEEQVTMEMKETMKKLRGWFPQEPKVGIIQSTNLDMQAGNWGSLPFLVSGILMILAAVTSAYFGFTLLNNLVVSEGVMHFHTNYANLYVGLLSVAAFGLDLFAALLLLLRKYAAVAETLAAVVLACGLASPWIFTYFHSPLIYMYWGTFVLQGLWVSLPMIAFSLVTLILVRLNRRKLKLDFNKRWTVFPFKVAGVLMAIASVPLAYNAAYLLWVIWFSGSALSSYVAAYLEVLFHLSLFGLDLFIAYLLLKRKRVGVAAAIVGVMLAVGLPLQLFLLKGFEDPFWVFDSPTIACLIATLILVGLNSRKLKQDTYINVQSELGAAKSEV
jgi:hypothetical protein